jgi:hypothetical protein
LFADPARWHWAQTGAFCGSVVVWVLPPEEERHGLAGCGALTPWHPLVKHDIPDPPPENPAPWQIWQEANPEFPGAFLATGPWTVAPAQFAIGP